MILELILFAALAFVLVKYKQRADKYKHFNGVSLFGFFFTKELHKKIANANTKLGCIDTPAFTMVLATHPDSAKHVLSNPEAFPKAARNTFQNSEKIFNHNILITNGEQWRQYRNVLSPPFHFDAVKQWIPHFHQLTLELMQHWTPLVYKNESVDVVRWMPLFTLDVLGTTVLSRSFNAMKGQEDKDLAALNTLLTGMTKPSTMILGGLERKTGLNLVPNLNKAVDEIEAFLRVILNSRKAAKNNEGQFDLIDVMLSAHNPNWTEQELVSNAFIMFVAGHETTSTALTWLFYHLATNKHVQARVAEEVKQVLKGQVISQDNIKELSYLNNVIKENLRMQPPVLMTATRVAESDEIVEGCTIPKGTRVGVNIYAIHHSPEVWSDPEEFNPDRFNKPTVPFGYLPFSLKSRACLGNQFSLVEQAVFFATLMQHFKVDELRAFKPPTGANPMFNQPKELKVTLSQV